ncbi:MAG TPA: helix-turn-helix transcriptional regulator [Candidatus Caccopulliclostridium gallistercoris]|uniref:Helix-turn-helix transcriptional regulator n=1 Tax=Candidatus Caccopulliclostridium gallistercoris TaxID=2840719 RepID=A0A9D1NEM1_9FIRM|nr:helix-turn-helix transcriptional regulator [Candidatus Caccopulliclostridium gallistercoris]
MNVKSAFAMRVSKILNERKISRYKLEKLSGISHTSMIRIFNGDNPDIMFSSMVKIIDALGMTLSEFFDDSIFKMENLDI